MRNGALDLVWDPRPSDEPSVGARQANWASLAKELAEESGEEGETDGSGGEGEPKSGEGGGNPPDEGDNSGSNKTNTGEEEHKGASSSSTPVPSESESDVDSVVASSESSAEPLQRQHHGRQDALAELELPSYCGGGKIVYYRNGDFVAYCGDECNHVGKPTCKKSKTAHASTTNPEQGYPLGVLGCWLFDADCYASQHDHVHFYKKPSYNRRKERREFLMSLPNSSALFHFEGGGQGDLCDEPRRCP